MCMPTAHVFSKKKKAKAFKDKKNKRARKYKWEMQPYYQGYIVFKAGKK